MSKTTVTAADRKLFENLPPDRRMELVLRYLERLRMLARSMASARRLDIVQILESVADDLNRRAREIAAATVGVDVLACAAALIVVAEDLEEEGTAPATVH